MIAHKGYNRGLIVLIYSDQFWDLCYHWLCSQQPSYVSLSFAVISLAQVSTWNWSLIPWCGNWTAKHRTALTALCASSLFIPSLDFSKRRGQSSLSAEFPCKFLPSSVYLLYVCWLWSSWDSPGEQPPSSLTHIMQIASQLQLRSSAAANALYMLKNLNIFPIS